eukprot:gene57730-biopygen55208
MPLQFVGKTRFRWGCCNMTPVAMSVTSEPYNNSAQGTSVSSRQSHADSRQTAPHARNGGAAAEEEIDGVFVSTGTTPKGSTWAHPHCAHRALWGVCWAMNPIPRNDSFQTGASFAPKCGEEGST